MSDNTNTSAVEALTRDSSLQAIMASEFKVRGFDQGIPTAALQACIVHVLEALASLQTKAPVEDGLAERLRGAVKQLDAIPPSLQTMGNIKIIDAAHDAADEIERLTRLRTDRAMVLEEAARKLEDMAAQREKERLALSNPIGALGSEIHARVTMLQTGASAIRALASKENR